MEKYMFYYVGGAFLIYGLYVVIWKIIPKIITFFKGSAKVVRNVKKLPKALFSSIYLNEKSTLSSLEYRKLSLGAIYSEQQTAYINSLDTGLKKNDIKRNLSEWWQINNSQDAYMKLEEIANVGQRQYFDVVCEAYKIDNANERTKFIKNSFDKSDQNYQRNIQNAYRQLDNLSETVSILKENGIILNDMDLEKYKNIGWDCGRLIFLSRMCFDLDFISKEDVWKYIDIAYDLAVDKFHSWKDYSNSYIIGRSMWGGKKCANEGIIEITKELLSNDNSPWVNMNLK